MIWDTYMVWTPSTQDDKRWHFTESEKYNEKKKHSTQNSTSQPKLHLKSSLPVPLTEDTGHPHLLNELRLQEAENGPLIELHFGGRTSPSSRASLPLP